MPWVGFAFIAAALLALRPPAWPQADAHWTAWADFAGFVLIAGAAALIAARGMSRVMRHWGNSEPGTPQAALLEFYRVVTSARPSARRISGLMRGFNLPNKNPRPVFHWLVAAAVPKLDSPKSVARYWQSLTRGNPSLVRRLRVLNIDLSSPKGDVALARVRLRAVTTHRLRELAVLAITLLVAALPAILGPDHIEAWGAPFWAVQAGALALAVALWYLLRRMARVIVERREAEVSKLLVRASHNWRLILAEWEAEDEADISWLVS